MKKSNLFIILVFTFSLFTQCKNMNCPKQSDTTSEKLNVSEATLQEIITKIKAKSDNSSDLRIERGVRQTATLWKTENGSVEELEAFCLKNFIHSAEELDLIFVKISRNFEIIWGNFLKMQLEVNEPIHMDQGELHSIDLTFGGFSPSAHLDNDLFNTKIAFIVSLNFPFYSLKEKNDLGKEWTSKQWAYSRLGDQFISRVPAELKQNAAKIATESDSYISEYNIYMGNLLDDQQEILFPKDLKLISHWGLRDELKSNYAIEDGLKKQKLIYEVMKRIIDQSIPEAVINNDEHLWNPYNNKLQKNDKEISFTPENATRYMHLLNNFKTKYDMDSYNPQYPTYIQRKFEENFELSREEVENLFIELVSSEQVKKVGKLISKRLNRNLEPFDIWYDGFKARGSISEKELDKKAASKYPNCKVFEKDIPNILMNLDFSQEQANYLASFIRVDAARGAGHAWGAEIKSEKSRLRTRVPENGMNYKGYNIAMHELGHNVEQTITLHNVDYYMSRGVPNTAFTEALAFIFQTRDLEMMGIKENNPDKAHYMALDVFWSCYEIMGVSLVDINVWKWLYANPNATPEQLQEAVISIAKDIWNKYYAEVFGSKDETVLAIYSHMIDAPLYLSAYPLGHLIEFQLEKQLKGKNFAEEINRIYTVGRTTPNYWMNKAVGEDLSAQPIIEATENALELIR